MKAIQIYLSVAAGKALIAKGLAAREEVQTALIDHTVLIVKGTTNGYLAEELLRTIDPSFTKKGFFRGLIKPASVKITAPVVEEDLIIRNGEVITGKTIYDVVDELGADDIAFKGANAVHLPSRKAGILIGNTTSGTIGPLMMAAVGRKLSLIHPVGVEKRVEDPIDVLAELCNDPGTQGLRMFPTVGKVYTELEAFYDLFGVNATILAGGGIGGYEGGCYFLVEGEEEALSACRAAVKELAELPMFEV